MHAYQMRLYLSYERSRRGLAARTPLEVALRRQYYHVKPLDEAQLAAWASYLDLEESGGSANIRRTDRLYERCLVACANYTGFWRRWSLWRWWCIGPVPAVETAERSCRDALRWRPDAHFFLADMLERAGRIIDARSIYHHVLTTLAPGLLEAAIRLSSFERRQGEHDAAMSAYEAALAAPSAAGTAATGTAAAGAASAGAGATGTALTDTTAPFLFMHMARYQERVMHDPQGAQRTLSRALAAVPADRGLWMAALELEARCGQEGSVKALFQVAVPGAFGVFGTADSSGVDSGNDGGSVGGSVGGGGGASAATGKAASGDSPAVETAMATTEAGPAGIPVVSRLSPHDQADVFEWYVEYVEDFGSSVDKVLEMRTLHENWKARLRIGDGPAGGGPVAAAADAANAAIGTAPAGQPAARLGGFGDRHAAAAAANAGMYGGCDDSKRQKAW
ncbi:unnamed protein product [Phaeothamnion confervicola]